jgi:hypothetical protein
MTQPAQISSKATSLLHLSVEEENLANVPFAVLERRVGKRTSKIQIQGTKILPDGREMHVCWQVQGNSELGLPTEQDLDIFVALGVLTFQNNFAKTVFFTGREIAQILGISGVHGKFYQRLKVAMDRFIALRFRALAETDRHEDVKWINVFQEANFTLDRESGRCVGSVTWTDKLIQSMNRGFFRVLDAGRYMELDGITGKHMYRFLAVAFEKTDIVVIDARKLAVEHLGILNPPKYLSRLMQTLEPVFDQLIGIQVLGSYHIVDSQKWELALHRHKTYVPERKSLVMDDPAATLELTRVRIERQLEKAGFSAKDANGYASTGITEQHLYQLERAARLIDACAAEGVLPHVAISLGRRALDEQTLNEQVAILDLLEIAIEVCRQKKASGQAMRNPAGLLVKIAKDGPGRNRLVSDEAAAAARTRYRHREQAAWAQSRQAEQRTLVLEYEAYREQVAAALFDQLSDSAINALRRDKLEWLKQQDRYDRLDKQVREAEIENLIRQDLAMKEIPPFEKWYLRRRAQQVILPFESPDICEAVAL